MRLPTPHDLHVEETPEGPTGTGTFTVCATVLNVYSTWPDTAAGIAARACGSGSELADLLCTPKTLDEPRGGELPTGGTWHVPALWCRPGTTYSWVFC